MRPLLAPWIHLVLFILALPALATGDEEARLRASDHAPIGVMGDHLHEEGEVMLSYRAMRMGMDGNRDGSSRQSASEVLQNYRVTPIEMDMEMHMLGVMWAPTDALTLMAMLPYIRLDMVHRTRMGAEFTTRSNGIGDAAITGLVRILETDHGHHLHANLGVSLPTGSISEKDNTPLGTVRLPYPMQLGSGTWDLLPGLTYKGESEDWSWGSQVRATLRTGRNNKSYRLGDRYALTGWFAYALSDSLSGSLRLDYQDWQDIDGDDDVLMPMMVATADPHLRAGRRLDLFVGVNWVATRGALRGYRLAAEIGTPLAQDLDGPQLETDWTATIGWQYAF